MANEINNVNENEELQNFQIEPYEVLNYRKTAHKRLLLQFLEWNI